VEFSNTHLQLQHFTSWQGSTDVTSGLSKVVYYYWIVLYCIVVYYITLFVVFPCQCNLRWNSPIHRSAHHHEIPLRITLIWFVRHELQRGGSNPKLWQVARIVNFFKTVGQSRSNVDRDLLFLYFTSWFTSEYSKLWTSIEYTHTYTQHKNLRSLKREDGNIFDHNVTKLPINIFLFWFKITNACINRHM